MISNPAYIGHRAVGVLILVLTIASGVAGAEGVTIMSCGDIAAWKERRFRGRTVYETVTLEGRTVLRATSAGAASGLVRRVRVDIEKTPILNWTWRVEGTLGAIDERTRAGDDYAARLYVVRSHPVFFWMTRAVNYVWSNLRPRGEAWPNAHSDAVRMVAVRSGDSEADQWVTERRNVRADFLKLFGKDVRYIDAVAVMTDTDDAGGAAVAYYGDIRFTSE